MAEYNYLLQILLFVVYFGWIWKVIQVVSEKDWFSISFMKTYKWVIAIFAFFAILGGELERISYELILAIEQGSVFRDFLPSFFGYILALMLLPLFFTYIVRIISPLFKYLHDKTNQ